MDEFLIEGFGTVTGPPTLNSILRKIEAAVEGKLLLELSPGEARVLCDYIEAF